MNDLEGFEEIILPFLKSDHGKKIINEFTNLTIEKYPWYYDELKGLSAGCGIEFDKVNISFHCLLNYSETIYYHICLEDTCN